MTSLRSCTLISAALGLALTAAMWGAAVSSLQGRVTLADRPLVSAQVSAFLLDQRQSKTVGQWATLTNADGSFTLKSLPYGTYVVVAKYQGRIVYQTKVQLNSAAGQQLKVDLKK